MAAKKPTPEELELQAPDRLDAAGLVQLDPDHPGFRDPIYRARRDAIARIAFEYRDGDPVPRVDYTDDEQEVWRTVWRNLAPLHDRYACGAYLGCSEKLRLDRARVPQLADVNLAIARATGFRMRPVAGLVSDRNFLGHLGRSTFLATQYMRHPSRPLYTPEPDVVHELVGHAATFCDPAFARLNRAFGEAAMRAAPEQLGRIARVYWYTLEFGLCEEGGGVKAYGAGLLSSFGELGRFEEHAELRPLDLDLVAATPYDPTDYQKVLYVAPALDRTAELVCRWLDRAVGRQGG
jgi:phenylalanine-4-hydroxylase